MITHIPLKRSVLSAVITTTCLCLVSISPGMVRAENSITFRMVPSAAAQSCLPKANGRVTVSSLGPVENMHIEVRSLPPETEFDFFVIQVPDEPFGLSSYQGDIETNKQGKGVGDFTGRFNKETFIVAPGSDVAPFIHNNAFPDATTNPPTGPVHTFHLGLWFSSPDDAAKAGCPNTVTPFNDEHNAGVQVLNTSNFPKDQGPLIKLEP